MFASMETPKILISVPHAMPPDPDSADSANSATGGHPWDSFAPEAGRILASEFAKLGASVDHFESDVNRTVLDMNRTWSRTSGWRAHIRETAVLSRASAVVDVHSFPPGCACLSGLDIAIVTPGRPLTWQAELAGLLAPLARVGLVVSPCMSDVVREFESLRVPSLMLEFSEGLSIRTATALASTIATETISARIPSPACRIVDGRVACYFVDARRPMDRVRLWFPQSSGSVVAEAICTVCEKPATKLCEACACVAYCGTRCQELDWESRKHWIVCSIVTMPPPPPIEGHVGSRRSATSCACAPDFRYACSLCGLEFCRSCGDSKWRSHVAGCYEDHVGLKRK